MNLINKLADFCDNRVKEYGAQYHTFAIFGLINYPLAFLYEYFVMHTTNGFIVRLISTLLSLGLFFKDHWPERFKKYLALYWYITLTYAVPFTASYVAYKGNLTLELLMNFTISFVVFSFILDTFAFLFIELLGVGLSTAVFCLLGNQMTQPDSKDLGLFLYMFFCTLIIGTVFSRNREVFEHHRFKEQQKINEHLEKIVSNRTYHLNELVQERTEELIKKTRLLEESLARQKEIEAELIEKNRLLEEAIVAKSGFMNNMSHEIRTPVHGFMALSDGLAQHWDRFDDEKKRLLAVQVSDSAKRLNNLLSHLLDLAKFNEGKMILQLQKFNLIERIDNLLEEARVLYIRDKDIALNFNQTGCVMMNADAERISQVLRNIVTNAIKFSPSPSSINIELKEAVLEDKKAIEIIIKDQGIGIPEKELENIFDPFVESSKTANKAGGTGLGLAIVKEIVRLHHGKVFAKNNKGAGAAFHVILPIEEISLSKDITLKHSRKGYKIVMIDDEEMCLMGTELFLTLNPEYHLIKCDNGHKGLDYLRKHKDVDLILLDLMMPGMNGIEVLEEIKHDKALSKIPVILQSGIADNADLDKAKEYNLADVLAKPYSSSHLIDALKRALKR